MYETNGMSTKQGYGSLLAEVTWTCTRVSALRYGREIPTNTNNSVLQQLSAEWAVLSKPNSTFLCVPFNELPSEQGPKPSLAKIEAEKDRIRNEIVNRTNQQIIEDDLQRHPDQKATKLMRALGSDLNINAFSLNFRHSIKGREKQGKMNDDVEEANYLMQRVVEALSVDSPTDDPTKIPLYLTSTMFSDELYGDCKKHFTKRLGLKESTQDLMVLRNVVMSPFPTDGNFIGQLAKIFKATVEKETAVVQKRNELGEDFHSFLIQGFEEIYLVHLPMFHVANHRQQLIVSADFENTESKARDKYFAMKSSSPTEPMILVTQNKTYLQEIIRTNGTFTGQIMTKQSYVTTPPSSSSFSIMMLTKNSGIILKNVTVTVNRTIVSRPLNSQWRLKDYPKQFMPFYLYGNGKSWLLSGGYEGTSN